VLEICVRYAYLPRERNRARQRRFGAEYNACDLVSRKLVHLLRSDVEIRCSGECHGYCIIRTRSSYETNKDRRAKTKGHISNRRDESSIQCIHLIHNNAKANPKRQKQNTSHSVWQSLNSNQRPWSLPKHGIFPGPARKLIQV
jgi:hypothetical protein